MDPETILDYALFQLTPTRTRCDLVVFSGKRSEKLASGLVDPFVSHLKYAKDQISKGGYSIKLRLPEADEDAEWFTKATFQRFVRFVSTPEILERIIRLEKEILQIESSVQSNEINDKEGEAADGTTKKSSHSSKINSEEVDGVAVEENSKIRLQRLMDTRKALLVKEQAMAYARAVVAGYEMDTIDDLICFADTFGASRLRVACTDFIELYKKKHKDDQWMGELAAVQAYPMPDLSYLGTSGIMLAGDLPLMRTASSELDATAVSGNSDSSKENNPATEQTPNAQQQVPWMNQIPQYMYNYQGPMPPYQGYPFPGMHPAQQYYAGQMGWPAQGGVPSKSQKNHKTSRRKERSVDANGSDAHEEDEETESSDSYTETDSEEEREHDKKHSSKGHKRNKKKTSKTVVIRNINYITRRNGDESDASDDDLSLDESSIREGVENAVASLDKHGVPKTRKSRAKWGSVPQNGSNGYVDEIGVNNSEGEKTNGAWGAFQDLLMSRDESTHNESNKSMDEHFVMRNSMDGLSNQTGNLYLESEKGKMKHLTADDSVLVIQRNGESVSKGHMVDFGNGEYINPSEKRIISQGEDALFQKNSEVSRGSLPDYSMKSSNIRNRSGEDWFVANSSGGSVAQETKLDTLSYERDITQKEAARAAVIDDSFIIESRPAVNESYVSNWRTDLGMEADIDRNGSVNGTHSAPEKSKSVETDEFCMMLVRESQESVGASWTPEMDYEVEISFNEAEKASAAKANGHAEDSPTNGKNAGGKKSAGAVGKNAAKDAKSKTIVSKSRLDYLSKSKKLPPANKSMMQKSKFQKEEEERRRMEEIRLERQKRIAERTAASGSTGAASKKVPVGSKAAPSKLDKSNSRRLTV